MHIARLDSVSFDTFLDCFLLAFENYYVKMPTDREYYVQRWQAAGVDYHLSYGMFHENMLVGFILHAVEKRSGVQIAFNTGTGVIPAYRGQKIVKALYAYALNDLRAQGIEQSRLEVIIENERAIRAYKGVGFTICKEYRGYAGKLRHVHDLLFDLREIPMAAVNWNDLPHQASYSWDYQPETLLRGNYTFYEVMHHGQSVSFFVIDPRTQKLGQFDVLLDGQEEWSRLFAAIQQVSPEVKIVNVDTRLTEKLAHIEATELTNTFSQYEMELNFKDVTVT